MADPQTLAKQFTDYYYSMFDTNRAGLHALYRPTSMMTWEGTQLLGVQSIVEKLTGLPFGSVQHRVDTYDAQPSSAHVAGMMVLVTGMLIVDGSDHPLHFSQVFQLLPEESGGYYVQNDVFRLNYG